MHSIQLLMDEHPDWAVASNDLRNGFNSLSRAEMLQRVHDSPFAHMLPGIQALYCRSGRLFVNGSPLTSTPRAANAAASRLGLRAPSPAVGPDSDSADSPMEYSSRDGCRQGDPHGPWLFALGIHATLLKVQEAYPDCHVFCYLDDAYIVGPPERAYEALKMLQQLARSECTLDTNLTKVDFYCPHALHDVVPPRPRRARRVTSVSSSARALPPMNRVRRQTIPTARYGPPKAIPA